MKTFPDMFTDRAQRERVLSEILQDERAAPGVTLVAYVERQSLVVRAIRSLPTPEGGLDAESCFDDEAIHRLSVTLCELAQDCVPQQTWVRGKGSPITGHLLTIVCRDGAPVTSPVESPYFWGWRYSNHLTSALDGEIYVVTPQGWASLSGQLSGSHPVLVEAVRPAVGVQTKPSML